TRSGGQAGRSRTSRAFRRPRAAAAAGTAGDALVPGSIVGFRPRRGEERLVSAKRIPTKYPGIYKRGSRYSYTYTDHLGRQRFGSAATIGEAKTTKAAKVTDVARGEFAALSKTTVTDYARTWAASYGGRTKRGISPDTLKDYRKALGLDADGTLT